jgi:hypothetical protein
LDNNKKLDLPQHSFSNPTFQGCLIIFFLSFN